LNARGLAKDVKTLHLILYHESMASLPNLLTAASRFRESDGFPSQQAQLLLLLLRLKRHRDDFAQLIAFISRDIALANLSLGIGTRDGIDASFMLCKIAFSLITLDTALLTCYNYSPLSSFPALCPHVDLLPSSYRLESEIEKCFQLAQESFRVVIKVTPLNTRPLVGALLERMVS
jgi:hypothetical protein